MTPKSSPSAKMSSKSGPFSEPSENELQKWTLFGSRPGGLREALTIRPPPLLAKGSLGRAGPEARVLLVFDPSKSLPGSSAQSALPCILRTLLVIFFSIPYGAHKLSKNYHILHPTSSKNDTQIWEKVLSKPVRKTLAKNYTFLSVSGTPGHVIRSHRRSRNTFFRFQRRTQKTLLFDPIFGPQILSKSIRNPFKNTHKKNTHEFPQKQQTIPKTTPTWEPKRVYLRSVL